jgi:hypothetical protein
MFLAPPRKRRRRGSGGFVRTPHFADSFQLFQIVARATGQHADVVARWQQKIAQQSQMPPAAESAPPTVAQEAAAPAPDAPAPTAPKKRRRGGRRRRKGATASTPAEKSQDPA